MSIVQPVPVRFDARRVAAVLRLRGATFATLARASGVSEVHLHFVIAGSRNASPRVLDALRHELGAAFDFACGRADSLTVTT